MPAPANQQNTKWADGLRGVASFLVVTAHISRSLAPVLLRPCLEENGGALPLQLPVFRTFVMGRASVAAFALLAGFVNALKPLRLARAGQTDAALSGLAKSAYRRTGRFILPSMVATIISWLACQFGLFYLGTIVDSGWIRDTSPRPSTSFAAAFFDLFHSLRATWINGSNEYDKVQWTLTFLLRGSMLVYLSCFATAYVQPVYRFGIFAILYMYYYSMGDAVIGINIYAGLMMAEMHNAPEMSEYVDSRPLTFGVLSTSMMALGLFANSYPEAKPEWAAWSSAMTHLGGYIFPKGAELARFYPAVGAQLICLGVFFNRTAQRLLSRPWPTFMGRHSFAVYLIHAPLIRTVLTWMLFGFSPRPPSPGKDAEGHPLPLPWVPVLSKAACLICIPIFYAVVYKLATLWSAHVDPWCGRVTNWVEQRIFRQEDRMEKA